MNNKIKLSPLKHINLEDSTNKYLKNLETLAFMKKLNHIKDRHNKFFDPKNIINKKNVSSISNSKYLNNNNCNT